MRLRRQTHPSNVSALYPARPDWTEAAGALRSLCHSKRRPRRDSPLVDGRHLRGVVARRPSTAGHRIASSTGAAAVIITIFAADMPGVTDSSYRLVSSLMDLCNRFEHHNLQNSDFDKLWLLMESSTNAWQGHRSGWVPFQEFINGDPSKTNKQFRELVRSPAALDTYVDMPK